MYQSKITLKKEAGFHLIFWIIWLYFNVISVQQNGIELISFDLFARTWLFVFVVTFYFNYLLILPWIFNPFKWIKMVLGIVIIFLFFILFRYFVEQILTAFLFNSQNYPSSTGIIYYIYDNVFFGMKPIVISSVFWMIVFILKTMDYNNYIIEQQKNTEIKFLKAQINPHFVFNTLNNIYSMVHFQSPNALPAIEKLSNIMRFTTYEAQRNHIPVSEEINYINSYIELEQLRHYEQSFVNWEIENSDDQRMIPPYLLSPLVENALKHGAYSENDPINITLVNHKDELKFEVKNTIGNQKKDKLGGIGLDNLKNRLEILYPEKHQLIIEEKEGVFTVKLLIHFQ